MPWDPMQQIYCTFLVNFWAETWYLSFMSKSELYGQRDWNGWEGATASSIQDASCLEENFNTHLELHVFLLNNASFVFGTH